MHTHQKLQKTKAKRGQTNLRVSLLHCTLEGAGGTVPGKPRQLADGSQSPQVRTHVHTRPLRQASRAESH